MLKLAGNGARLTVAIVRSILLKSTLQADKLPFKGPVQIFVGCRGFFSFSFNDLAIALLHTS